MLQAYRKDLQEFGSGLKKETSIIAHVAAHAVKDLPASLETGASVAQESLESVGQVIEDFGSSVWRGTAEILKEAVLTVEEGDDSVAATAPLPRYDTPTIAGGKYSRIEAQIRAIQHDSSTYCEEPEDVEDFKAWQSTFDLRGNKQDVDSLLEENTFLQELLARLVPDVVTEETFWTRYFYRLHKLRQTEEARAHLVKRATASEEEDLSWDTDDDTDEGGAVPVEERPDEKARDQAVENPGTEQVKVEASEIPTAESEEVGSSPAKSTDAGHRRGKGIAEGTLEDDDLGWEVAEDLEESSSNDGKKSSNSEASWEVPEVPTEDIKRRFTAPEEEDLSWDVDDLDDDVKP